MRMPSFTSRHPWIGLLIVVTIGCLVDAACVPHPATESMPRRRRVRSVETRPARPGCMAVPMRASRWSGTPTECPYCRAYFPRSSAGSTPIPR